MTFQAGDVPANHLSSATVAPLLCENCQIPISNPKYSQFVGLAIDGGPVKHGFWLCEECVVEGGTEVQINGRTFHIQGLNP